jgi:hypothetical protein
MGRMSKELSPADIDLIPIGSVLPFLRGNVSDPDFAEFNGQTISREEYPELFILFDEMHEGAEYLLSGWGGVRIDDDHMKLPDLDKDAVVQMLWGVRYEHAPDVCLAIRTQKSLPEK